MGVSAYPAGEPGLSKSIETIASYARECRYDMDMVGWVVDVYTAAGIDGRDKPSVLTRATALLDAFRAKTVYKPDGKGTEWIQKPHVTLCLRDHCIPGGDCDDLQAALCGAFLAAGLDAYIVRQSFGAGQQPHVLVGILDGGTKYYADPSTREAIYAGSKAQSEQWIDPMKQVSKTTGTTGAELATFGAPPTRAFRRVGKHWVEDRYKKTYVHENGSWRETAPGYGKYQRPAGFGAGIVTPGTVLAYRSLWDGYVTGMARAAAACGKLWSSSDPSINTKQFAAAPDATTMQIWANAEQGFSDSITASWNAHQNMSDAEIVISAADILQDFQNVVLRCGQFYAPQIARDCPSVTLPAVPSVDLQKVVIAEIEGEGILAHGVLQLLGIGVGGALEAAGEVASQVKQQVNKVADFLASPWPWAAVAVVGGVYVADRIGVFDAIRAAASRRRRAT